MEVPYLDLKAQYLAHREEFDTAIQKVIDKTAFAGGPFVQKFEEEFRCSIAKPNTLSV